MDNDVVVGLTGTILGVGGTGGIGLLVSAWRAHRKGKIEDDGTLIDRLNQDSKHQADARRAAEDERDETHHRELRWMNQALAYRMQLVYSVPPIQPNDHPELWGMIMQTGQVEPPAIPPEILPDNTT